MLFLRNNSRFLITSAGARREARLAALRRGMGAGVMLLCALLLAACDTSARRNPLGALPTAIPSIEEFSTAQYLTQNAPPEGFREAVSFPQVDANLRELPGWHYTMLMQFEGVFARTPRETSATTRAEVWFEQIGQARRVLVETSGELLLLEEGARYEAVRLGPDVFLVRDGACLTNVQQDAQTAADLQAGDLIGGVNRATPTARNAGLNGVQAWEYTFTFDDLNLPFFSLADGGQVNSMSGELWVAPEHNVVVRYYLTMEVENAVLTFRTSDTQLPVSGQLIIRYDLTEIGQRPNISVPFGC